MCLYVQGFSDANKLGAGKQDRTAPGICIQQKQADGCAACSVHSFFKPSQCCSICMPHAAGVLLPPPHLTCCIILRLATPGRYYNAGSILWPQFTRPSYRLFALDRIDTCSPNVPLCLVTTCRCHLCTMSPLPYLLCPSPQAAMALCIAVCLMVCLWP